MTDPGAYISESRTKECQRCGAMHLMWAKSKAGKFYLCETYPSQDDNKRLSGIRWIAPWVPHNCEKSRARGLATKEATR